MRYKIEVHQALARVTRFAVDANLRNAGRRHDADGHWYRGTGEAFWHKYVSLDSTDSDQARVIEELQNMVEITFTCIS